MLLIDKRSGSINLLNPLKDRLHGQVKTAFLRSPDGDDIGDACWEGSYESGNVLIGCEYKRLTDMLSSMRNGRYIDQLNRMLDSYQFIYLLVEGVWRPSDRGIIEVRGRGDWRELGMSSSQEQRAKGIIRRGRYYYSELDSFFAALEIMRGVRILRSGSLRESVEILANRYTWWNKPWDEHKSVQAIKTKTLGLFAHQETLSRLVAAQLPGVGWGRSKDVAKRFPSVEGMMLATIDDWESIEGIGPKTARRVYEAIRKEGFRT